MAPTQGVRGQSKRGRETDRMPMSNVTSMMNAWGGDGRRGVKTLRRALTESGS